MKFSKVIFLLAGVSAGVLFLRSLRNRRPQSHLYGPTPQPHPEHARSVPDERGNYDIDGVSIDRKGVMIGSDAHHVNSIKHPSVEEMH